MRHRRRFECRRRASPASPLAPGDNAVGVLQTCGWMTGFPMRTGFGRGYPEHDPWRFDGDRLVASGEADCVLWISAYRAAQPPWNNGSAGDRADDRRGRARRTAWPSRSRSAVPASTTTASSTIRRPGRSSRSLPRGEATRVSVADAIGRIAAALLRGGFAMMTRIAGGRVIDPAHDRDGCRRRLDQRRPHHRCAAARHASPTRPTMQPARS